MPWKRQRHGVEKLMIQDEQATQTATDDEDGVHFIFRRVNTETGRLTLEEVFSLRFRVYCLERGFLPAGQYPDGKESDEYDDISTHFTAFSRSNQLAGTVRLILPCDDRPFPYELHCRALYDHLELPPRSECGEVSRLIVDKNYHRRRGDTPEGVSEEILNSNDPIKPVKRQQDNSERRISTPEIVLGLYRQMYHYALETGIRYWYAAMERSLARVLSRLGFNFNPIGLETDYYGPVTPYLADLREIERALDANNPELMAWFREKK
jgi:N-acyl amino acid synthase of PEP-CTERM/exosortase system